MGCKCGVSVTCLSTEEVHQCMDSGADIVAYYRRGGVSRAGVKSSNILVVEERCKKLACGM